MVDHVLQDICQTLFGIIIAQTITTIARQNLVIYAFIIFKTNMAQVGI